MENATYKCWLNENRMVVGHLTGTLGNETQILVQETGEPYFYYEGELAECVCNESNTLRLIPHGHGTLHSIYDVQVVISGTFEMGHIEGFTNVIIPSKNIDMTCTYAKGIPNKTLPYLLFKDDQIQFSI